jgi:protein-disulfide isomerase-like protein with CxxC motif
LSVEIIEFTDPGCIWSWSSDAKLARLRESTKDVARWRRVLGIAGPRDGTPEELRASWIEVAAITGATVPDRLEHVPDSLVLSRAARAAENQGRKRAEAVLRRLRESVFEDGRPADSPERLREALTPIEGLDVERLIRDLESSLVLWTLDADRTETRRPHPDVVARRDGDDLRYPFPTLIVRGPGGERILAGWIEYEVYSAAIADVTSAQPVAR